MRHLVRQSSRGGPKLHRHPYAEVFLVQESATFTVGEDTIDVTGGQILIAPAGVPHKFVNSGAGPLRQIDIHANDRFVTEWLEETVITAPRSGRSTGATVPRTLPTGDQPPRPLNSRYRPGVMPYRAVNIRVKWA